MRADGGDARVVEHRCLEVVESCSGREQRQHDEQHEDRPWSGARRRGGGRRRSRRTIAGLADVVRRNHHSRCTSFVPKSP